MSEPIPEHVLDALEAVRDGGAINMWDRGTVILLATEEATDWLEDNRDRYMEALIAMGERRK